MKLLILNILLLLFVANSTNAQVRPKFKDADTITAAQAKDYQGKRVTVCDRVNYGRYVNVNKNAPVRLWVGPDYPNHYLTLVFPQNDLKRFSVDPEKKMLNKRFCVVGRITSHEGKPAIIVKEERQLNAEE
ncbi:hypothetical protein [Aridibaculum aurantiacum]|uniref:hypothetical protein n=1 Tax=Aridibaculum aurantiacum TaxID=2810307 RepID=UPI001A96BE52|nr:hypothetical protein [Aridibaculum aurantiacum]